MDQVPHVRFQDTIRTERVSGPRARRVPTDRVVATRVREGGEEAWWISRRGGAPSSRDTRAACSLWSEACSGELFAAGRSSILSVDARACEGVLLRVAAGQAKRLSTKQLLVHGAMRSYGVEMQSVPRAANLITNLVGGREFKGGIWRVACHTLKALSVYA